MAEVSCCGEQLDQLVADYLSRGQVRRDALRDCTLVLTALAVTAASQLRL